MGNPFRGRGPEDVDERLDEISESASGMGCEILQFFGLHETPTLLAISSQAEPRPPAREATMMYQIIATSLPEVTIEILTQLFVNHMDMVRQDRLEEEQRKAETKKTRKRGPIHGPDPGDETD